MGDTFATGVEMPEAAIQAAVDLALRFVPCAECLGQDDEGAGETPGQEGGLFGMKKRVTSGNSQTEPKEGGQVGKDGPLYAAPVDELSETVQTMYDEVRRLTSEDVRQRTGSGDEDEAEEQGKRVENEAVDAAVEVVETALADELYDRWFCPVGSGDTAADAAMAGRIAGLNLLDLTL